jgi:hypothetical protein
MNIYHDLCLEIEAYEEICEQLQSETVRLFNLMNKGPQNNLTASYEGMPFGGKDESPLYKLYNQMRRAELKLNTARDILMDKKQAKTNIEKKMDQFSTLEYKVAYKRDIERKPLDVIALELNYSYDWIKKISSRVKKLRVLESMKAL